MTMRHSIDVRNYALVSIWGRDSVTVPVPWRINWTLKDQPRFESAGKVVIKSESRLMHDLPIATPLISTSHASRLEEYPSDTFRFANSERF
jgi:hypothetical protein